MDTSYHIQPSLFDSDDTPLKRCFRCGEDFPATLEYFMHSKTTEDELEVTCKRCRKAARKATKEVLPEGMMRCKKCKDVFPFEAFPANSRSKNGRTTTCKQCINKRNRERTKDIPHVINPQAPTKVCSECGEELATTLENFGFCRRSKDRLRSCCKKCDNKRHKTWYQSPQGQECTRTYTQEHSEELNEYRREYRKTHRDEELAYKRQYHDEHKEEEKAYTKAVRSTPEGKLKRRIEAHTRRANERAVAGEHSPEEILEQLKRQKYKCYYAACGHSKFPKVKNDNGEWEYEYHVDHTYPISRIVGTDIPGNDMGYLVLTCGYCNVHKWSKFPWEWPEGGRLL